MTYVTKFRANDLNPSKGKQIEFNKGVADTFFKFTNDEASAEFECHSLADDAFKKTIKVSFKISPARGDYKVYQNADGSSDLKDVFLQELHLTSAVNGDDFYAIRDKGNGKYLLYYVPKSALFTKFFPVINGDQILVAEAGKENGSASGKVRQLITYGAPGTGKSHKIDKCTNESNSIRVTFHPDTDYAAFVGAYKPTMAGQRNQVILDYENLVDKFKEYLSVPPANVTRACALFGYDYHDSIRDMIGHGHTIPELVNDAYKSGSTYDSVVRAGMSVYEQAPSETESISYSFVPQAFMKAYVEAWRRYTDAGLQGDAKTYYLVIEEINRGNCAQIFGDLFQLLDRADNGFSAYAITPDDDIQKFLETDKDYKLVDIPLAEDIKKTTEDGEKVIATAADVKTGKKLVLPPNLCIWATMNTSDQSLFPIDSAFKRRWDWEYVPIEDAEKGWKIDVGGVQYKWWSFLEKINDVIASETSSEDKQLGYFFVKAKGDVIDAKTFVSKVIFYLWGDVFKDNLPDEDAFKYTFTKDGKANKRLIRFADFYHPETGNTKDQWRDKLLTSFLGALKVEESSPAANTSSAPNTSGAPNVPAQGSSAADGNVTKANE